MKDHGYGKDRYHFDGASLPSLYRSVRANVLTGTHPDGRPITDQAPVYRFPTPDKARLRAKECVRRFMKLMRRTG
jgi:hypothetical protein